MEAGAPNIYEMFNLIVRRDPKENNFKAVLESIRDLMNTQCAVSFDLYSLSSLDACIHACSCDQTQVPDWLHDIFLGYGDVGLAHYSKLSKQVFCYAQ
jgi:intron-binding protein aquarius